MRERVALYGGRFDAAALAGGLLADELLTYLLRPMLLGPQAFRNNGAGFEDIFLAFEPACESEPRHRRAAAA